MTTCVPKGVFIFIEVLDADFRTVTTGRFDNWHIWEYLLDGVWVRASRGNFPSTTNNVFIGHATNLEKSEQCKDFNINTLTTFDGEGHELRMHGKIRKYTGTAPGTDDPAGGSIGFLGVNSTFVFTGLTDLTIADASEFGTANNWGFKTVIDYGNFKASTVGNNALGEDLEVKAGTLEVLNGTTQQGIQLLPVDGVADSTKTSLLIKAAARFNFDGRPGQSSMVGFGSYILELDAFLGVKGAASFIKAHNIMDLLGTVELLESFAQNFPEREDAGELAVDTFATVRIGTSAKTLQRNIIINTLLSIESDASIVPSGFAIDYNGNLIYKLGTGRTTIDVEIPAVDPPIDVIIEEDVQLHANKTIGGDVIINSNELDLSLADFIGLTA